MMGGDKPAENVEDWADDAELRLSEVPDEEAQLLQGEDYEQFELDETFQPASSREASQRRPGSAGQMARKGSAAVMAAVGFAGPVRSRMGRLARRVPLTLNKGTATDASGTAIRHVDCVDTLWKRDDECSSGRGEWGWHSIAQRRAFDL
ncbi:hypothetical protein L209DRAFT_743652 [Thermothelomyces heterothallicus CBS 203.75]